MFACWAPPTVPPPSLACTAHVSALRAPPVYCKPLQSLWLAWIVYSTTGYAHSRRRLAPLCPSSIRRTGETGTACLRVVLERSLGCPCHPPKSAHPRAPTLPSIKSSPPSVAKLFPVSPPSLHHHKRSAYLLSYRLWRLSQALAPCKPPRFLAKHTNTTLQSK